MSFKRRGVPETAKYREATDLGTSHTCNWSGANLSLFSYLTTLYLHVRISVCNKMSHRGLGLVSRRMRWVQEGMGYGWGEKKQIVMVEKHEGSGPLRTPTNRWDNINMDLKETGWDSMAWTRIILLRIETSGMLL